MEMAVVRLDIGCGRSKFKGTLGVDIVALPGVDVVADLTRGLPFRDNSISEIYTSHTLEHVDNLPAVMEELWRVCKPNALVHIWVPHASCPFVTSVGPTHKPGMTLGSVLYFHPAPHPLTCLFTPLFQHVQ